jgi:hypothetical protein
LELFDRRHNAALLGWPDWRILRPGLTTIEFLGKTES